MINNIVEKHFEVEVCDYTPQDLEKIINRLNEIDNHIEVHELGKCSDSNNLKIKVIYYEEEDKNELEKTIVDTFQFSDLWNKCIIK